MAGRLVVLSGPSGSGKSTLCRSLALDPRVHLSVSATTRPRRPGEVEGRDYFFLEEARFQELVAAGAFLEWARYNRHCYGTLRVHVDQALAGGRTVILEIEVQGAAMLRRRQVAALYLFLEPPSLAVLEDRLRGRGTETDEEVRRRLELAREEWELARAGGLYDRFVVNDDLERALAEARSLLGLDGEG